MGSFLFMAPETTEIGALNHCPKTSVKQQDEKNLKIDTSLCSHYLVVIQCEHES